MCADGLGRVQGGDGAKGRGLQETLHISLYDSSVRTTHDLCQQGWAEIQCDVCHRANIVRLLPNTHRRNHHRFGLHSLSILYIQPPATIPLSAPCCRPYLQQILDYTRIYDVMIKPAFVFDGRNILNHNELRAVGFRVFAIGQPFEPCLQEAS
jgi:hypothetical protein